MPIRRDARGRWRYRKVISLPDGTRRRIFGTPAINKTWAAEKAEEAHNRRLIEAADGKERKEVPTFEEWFNGRFWDEWVIAERSKPSEKAAKECAFRVHLQPIIGKTRLDDINAATVQQIRAALVAKKIGDKRITT